MQIITRQEAIRKRLSKYFTGKPCKSGHIAERYLINSACEDCVHPKVGNHEVLARKSERETRAAAKSRMVRSKFRINDCDLEAFQLMILALCMMREPTIRTQDISSKWTPLVMSATKRIYAFMIFPQDEAQLREHEVHLEKLHDAPSNLRPLNPLPSDPDEYWPDDHCK